MDYPEPPAPHSVDLFIFSSYTTDFLPTFLTDLPTHGGLEAGQVLLLRLGQAVRDGEGGVVKRVSALWISVTPTLPTLYSVSCEKVRMK